MVSGALSSTLTLVCDVLCQARAKGSDWVVRLQYRTRATSLYGLALSWSSTLRRRAEVSGMSAMGRKDGTTHDFARSAESVDSSYTH